MTGPRVVPPVRLPEREDQFITWVLDQAHLFHWHVAHFRPAQTSGGGWRTPVQADGRGFPDLVLVRERVVYAELKSAAGRLEPEQRAWRDRLLEAGAEWHLWRPDHRDEIAAVLAPTIAASIAHHPSRRR